MKRAMAVLGSLVLIGLLAPAPSAAQDALTKRDGRGPVAVTVALLESPAVGSPVRVRVALDTHSVGLDGITFGEAVAIRAPDGAEVPPASVERTSGGGHHREAVLLFPAVRPAGTLVIVVKDVGGIAERLFSWELPPAR